MTSIQFPSTFVKLLFECRSVFTKPSFTYFEAILAGILLGRPKKTVTAAVKLAGLEKQFSNVNRFVSRYRWDAGSLGLAVLRLVLKVLKLTSGSITMALDSTFLAKFGAKIFGCGYHYNYARKHNLPSYLWGHDWLVLGLLYFSTLFNKWLCFPFLAQLFVPEKYLPKNQPYRSSIEIASEMILYVKEHIKQTLILIADGYFAKKMLIRNCIKNGITLISRLQSNAALYLLPLAEPQKKRGRPRKYGQRLASLKELAKSKSGFEHLELKLYGKKRKLRVKRIDALWIPAGQVIQVLMVFYEDHKKPAFFFCTDLKLSAADILTRVAARWSLENLFKDIKEHLGWTHWQCRVEKAVRRSATLTCSAASLLILWSHQQASQKQPELWDVLPWYSKKASPSFKDMLEQFRRRIIDNTFLALKQRGQTMAENEKILRDLLKLAA
jgi:hypothetical protein